MYLKNKFLKALIFDSVYNPFRGVETYFRVFSGQIEKGQSIKFLATQKKYNADLTLTIFRRKKFLKKEREKS